MTGMVALVCFLLLISPAIAYYANRREQQTARDRVLERRLTNSPATLRTQPAWTTEKGGMARVLAWLSALPWVGGHLSETMRQASAQMLMAIPVLFVVASVVASEWMSLPVALLAGVGAAAMPLLYLRRKR